MGNKQLGVPQIFLARGLKPTALTALVGSSGAAKPSGMWEAPQVPNPTCEGK